MTMLMLYDNLSTHQTRQQQVAGSLCTIACAP
jgi:hypothetical protein